MEKLMKTQVRAKCAVRGGRPQRLPSVVASVSRPQVVDHRAGGGIYRPEISFKISSLVGQAIIAGALVFGGPCMARMEGVNKPELLPPGPVTPVIDVAGFLTEGEEARIKSRVEKLESDTGVRLRVLAQNYPETPGLAIKDYWKVDEDTVVFVADPNTGNILNFNVGENVDFRVPRTFWSRLAGKYGNKFYWRDAGEDVAIVNAVAAIDNCMREPVGKLQCNTIRGELE